MNKCPKCESEDCDLIMVFKPNMNDLHVGSFVVVHNDAYRITGWDTLPGEYRELHCVKLNV